MWCGCVCRAFLKAVYLHGETQQKTRILELFAERYRRQNVDVFQSTDACFRMAVAVVLLNTDLYIHKGESKLSLKEWAGMLAAATEDKGAYDPAMIKTLYTSIRTKPLELPDSEIELMVCIDGSLSRGNGALGNRPNAHQCRRQWSGGRCKAFSPALGDVGAHSAWAGSRCPRCRWPRDGHP